MNSISANTVPYKSHALRILIEQGGRDLALRCASLKNLFPLFFLRFVHGRAEKEKMCVDAIGQLDDPFQIGLGEKSTYLSSLGGVYSGEKLLTLIKGRGADQ